MAVLSHLLFAVALASTVAGQCSNSETLTVTASADISQVASCTTYSGSITIPTLISDGGDSERNRLSVEGVERIVGNVTINDVVNLAGISFPDLTAIVGLQLGGLTVLSELSMPQIQEIRQLNLTAMPALQELSFGGDGVTRSQSILITNTGLSSLQGLDQLKSVDSFNVNNNGALQNISLSVASIKNAINIAANADFENGVAASFPELVTARNMTFRNCSSVSLPSLANVSEYLGLYGNTMESFSALNLTTTGGLVFVDNTELTNITIPNLMSVNGSFQIANNTMLDSVAFPELTLVTASIDMNGNFSEVDLPKLKQVRGTFNLQTSSEFDCSGFDAAKKSKGIIRGNPYVCRGKVAKPGGTGSKVSSGSSASGTSAADVNAINYQAVIGSTSIIAGLLQLFL